MNIIEKAMQASSAKPPREPGSVIVEAVAAAEQRAQAAGPAAAPEASPAAPAAVAPASRNVGPVRFSELSRNGFFGPDGPDPRLLAEIRHLKRSIIRGISGPLAEGRSNVIAVTSALPAAGKTYLAASLAQALTLERDRGTLLVDGDDVRCTLSKSLGQAGARGLFDVLHDRTTEPASVIQATDLPGLSFMATGGRFDDSLELLTSKRAIDVVAALSTAEPNRIVIVDCPPLLGTPNGAALAALAGQTLLVVEAGVTDSETLKKAIELLGRDRPIGLVLNKVPRSGLLSSRVGSYYYYAPRE